MYCGRTVSMYIPRHYTVCFSHSAVLSPHTIHTIQFNHTTGIASYTTPTTPTSNHKLPPAQHIDNHQFTKRYWSRIISSSTFHSRRHNYWHRQYDTKLYIYDRIIQDILVNNKTSTYYRAHRNNILYKYKLILRSLQYIQQYDTILDWYIRYIIRYKLHGYKDIASISTTKKLLSLVNKLNIVQNKLYHIEKYHDIHYLRYYMQYAYGYKGVLHRMINELNIQLQYSTIDQHDTIRHKLVFFPPLLQYKFITSQYTTPQHTEQLFQCQLYHTIQCNRMKYDMNWLIAYESILGEYKLTIDQSIYQQQIHPTYHRFQYIIDGTHNNPVPLPQPIDTGYRQSG